MNRLVGKKMLLGLLIAVVAGSLPAIAKADGADQATAKQWLQAADRASQAMRMVAEKVRPSVVGVNTAYASAEKPRLSEWIDPLTDNLREFFGQDYFDRFLSERQPGEGVPFAPRGIHRFGQASGLIVSSDGYILTNHHAIDGADSITVQLYDGQTLPAKVVGADRKYDLAVLKVDGKELPAAKLGDSDSVQLFDWVIAMGSPYGIDQAATYGTVSAKGSRSSQMSPYEEFLQTTAPINQGIAGGPLVNLKGEVIGLTTALFSGKDGSSVNFAIPINRAKSVMSGIVKHGHFAQGFLGIAIQDLTPDLAQVFGLPEDQQGVLVGSVEADTSADEAGLRRGDIITHYRGKPVKDAQTLRDWVAGTNPGTDVKLQVFRNGKPQGLAAKIGELPKSLVALHQPSAGLDHRFGFTVQPLSPDLAKRWGYEQRNGVVISNVRSGSIADLAGLREGWIVLEVNRQPVKGLAEYSEALSKATNDSGLLLLVGDGHTTRYVFMQTK